MARRELGTCSPAAVSPRPRLPSAPPPTRSSSSRRGLSCGMHSFVRRSPPSVVLTTVVRRSRSSGLPGWHRRHATARPLDQTVSVVEDLQHYTWQYTYVGRTDQSQQKSAFWGVPYYVKFTLLLLHSSVAPRRRELGPPRRFTSRSESGSTCVQQAFVREYHDYKRNLTRVSSVFRSLRLSHPVVHSPASLDATADRLASEAGGWACAER